MEELNYKRIKASGYKGYILEEAPEKILQFGEGNFLRAFVDYWFDVSNERVGWNGKAVLVQPIAQGLAEQINRQEGLYTLYLRGRENGEKVDRKRVISSVSRCLNPYEKAGYDAMMQVAESDDLEYIVSNTTEAGIVYDPACRKEDCPPASFPAKLTQVLYRRWQAGKKPVVILSCELIDNNGKELEKCVLQYADQWKLGEEFITWIKQENIFCSTLVDRIVTGYPRNEAASICEELGYQDNIIDTGEVFGFWVIEGPESLKEELPFEKAGLPVLITNDHKPYKQRKVRILNGAHTSFVLGAYLAGQDIVRDCMEDEVICGFMNKTIYDEIIPTLTLPKEELKSFAASVTERFKNPFIDHALLSISLNSTSKWKARVMPSLKGYIANTGKLPECITASFAFYIAFYRGKQLTEDGLIAARPAGNEYTVKDDRPILKFFYDHREDDAKTLVDAVCSNEEFWGEDLTAIAGFEDAVAGYVADIWEKGAYEVMKGCLDK